MKYKIQNYLAEKGAFLAYMVFFAVGFFYRYGSANADGGTGEGLFQIEGIFCNILNWLYTFALIVGVIMILVAAFQYMTANGNAEKVESATKTILYAVIGLLIAIIAKGAPFIVGSILDITGYQLRICGGTITPPAA